MPNSDDGHLDRGGGRAIRQITPVKLVMFYSLNWWEDAFRLIILRFNYFFLKQYIQLLRENKCAGYKKMITRIFRVVAFWGQSGGQPTCEELWGKTGKFRLLDLDGDYKTVDLVVFV